MEWMELASSYEVSPDKVLTWYDQFRLGADHYRFWIIYVYLLAVYYLGFATRIRMPILKTVMLLLFIGVGSLVFSILDTTLPVRGGLFVAVIILVIVKLRIKPDQSSRR
ncbi:YlaH-like family protein [Brevibacillus dissolubilis]|uniref:YlaH-like family protein n=1 Tax=Brevibacillus dissolubilis TaxID=1844116 RepID=UPI001116A1AC|nr:YlaH-like family protein [Brevibacillus dissolubilis]